MQYGRRTGPHLKNAFEFSLLSEFLGRQIILGSEMSLKNSEKFWDESQRQIQNSVKKYFFTSDSNPLLWWCHGLYRLFLAGIWICDMEGKFWPAIVKHWGLMENIEYFGLFPHLPKQHRKRDHQHDEKCNPRQQASLSEAWVEEGSSNTSTTSTWTPSSQYIPEKPEFIIPTKCLSQIIFYLMTIRYKNTRENIRYTIL